MRAKLVEHVLSILLVAGAIIAFVNAAANMEQARRAERIHGIEPYLQLDFLDFGDPLHAALFKETLNAFSPTTPGKNDSLLQSIQEFRQEQFTSAAYKSGGEDNGLSRAKLERLGGMYLQFILIYLTVIVVTYRAAQSLAIYRFIKTKQDTGSALASSLNLLGGSAPWSVASAADLLRRILKTILRLFLYAVLFAPAYVIAYSIRSSFDTDSYLFLIALAVISNGLLINYANKFFTLLTAESRKGYVETALVKNLDSSYEWNAPDGVSSWAVLHPGGLFPSHVFRHIYLNARYQFLITLKEHASFIITGLIIIEMALNIQGHLGYEMLQNILYGRYDVVATIILGIFLVVKATEVVTDLWFYRETRHYENKA